MVGLAVVTKENGETGSLLVNVNCSLALVSVCNVK